MENLENNLKIKLKDKSYELFEKIKIYDKEAKLKIDSNRFIDDLHLYPDSRSINSSVIVIGINPSSSDLDNNRKPDPCYIHSIPKELSFHLPNEYKNIVKKWGAGKSHKHLCYPRYFSHIYPLFNQTDYYPLFSSEIYNQRWLKIYEENDYPSLSDLDISVIDKMSNKNIQKFIFMQDLLPFKETISNKIGFLFSIREIQNLIIDILAIKFEYLKPKCIIQHWAGIDKTLQNKLQEISPDKGFISSKFIPRSKKHERLYLKHEINKILGIKYVEENLTSKWDYLGNNFK